MNTITNILQKEFNIEVLSIKNLVGEVNDNYLIDSTQGKFVFKSIPLSSENIVFNSEESHILELLSDKMPGMIQQPVKTVEGHYMVRDKEENRLYRLVGFLEGQLLSHTKHTEELFASFGQQLAEMDKHLMRSNFTNVRARQYHWDILQFDQNIKQAEDIPSISDRRLVKYFHLQYNEIVRPLLSELRYSTIHNDANDYNVLVNENKVSGIIDFGDCVYSLLINELAVALTYALLDKENPIEWAVPIIKGYHSVIPLEEKELEILFYLIAARLCISICHSAVGKKNQPENGYLQISEKPVLKLLRKWITLNPVKAEIEFKKAAGYEPKKKKLLKELVEIRGNYLSKALSLSYSDPIKMEKAALHYMYDAAGKTYLDLRNNIPHVGHCHPKVVVAGQKAMARLNTNTRYLYDEIDEFSEKLLSKFPKSLNRVFYVNSGSAASDLAIRLAKTHTRRKKMLVMEHGYHGNTDSVIDISHYKYSGKGGKGFPNDTLAAPVPVSNDMATEEDLERFNSNMLQQYLNLISTEKSKIAGFITEPIISAAGQIVIEEYYLKELYNFIRSNGGVCISDEVQTGFGRLGKHYWGFEYCDVIPDIVVLGKPIGNGHPMAAVVCTEEIADSFNNGMEFFSSFGGNPVSCAIGAAVLQVIEEEKLEQNAEKIGNYLIEEFKKLRKTNKNIGDIRGMGLSLGIEIVKEQYTREPDTEKAKELVEKLKENGLLAGTDGPFDNVFKLKPPLCFTMDNAVEFMEIFSALISSEPNLIVIPESQLL